MLVHVEFKEREGHCRASSSGWRQPYGIWLSNQQQAHSKGQLNPERYDKLKELGVEWLE